MLESYKKLLNEDIVSNIRLAEVEIQLFKKELGDIQYEFKVESFDDIIKKDIHPIILKQKQDKTDFVKEVLNYINNFDSYSNKYCEVIFQIALKQAVKIEEHKVIKIIFYLMTNYIIYDLLS